MWDWVFEHEVLLAWLAGASLASLVLTAIALPIVVARLPADYFTPAHRERRRVRDEPTRGRLLLHLAKNTAGALFVVAGIAMLVLPGQGLLTILIGVVLCDFPRKYELERWIVGRPAVLRALNWIRRKAHRPPLHLDDA